MDGVFVTGTGTEVGKTVVAGSSAHRARAGRLGVPSSSRRSRLTSESRARPTTSTCGVRPGSARPTTRSRPTGTSPRCRLTWPRRWRASRSTSGACGRARGRPSAGDFLVCEGVGGFLVPLRTDYLVRDFARDCGLPRRGRGLAGLGTINHTLLTVESVRAAGLEVRAVVLTPWPEHPSASRYRTARRSSGWATSRCERVGVVDPGDPESWPVACRSRTLTPGKDPRKNRRRVQRVVTGLRRRARQAVIRPIRPAPVPRRALHLVTPRFAHLDVEQVFMWPPPRW